MTKEEAINLLADMDSDKYTAKEAVALTMAIKALEQEPFINKQCVSSGVCEHDKRKVLDEIRAEIDQLPSYVAKFAGGAFAIHIDKTKVLRIIDKHLAESETE